MIVLIRTIEGNFYGGNRIRTVEGVERFSSEAFRPVVVGLVSGDAGLKEKRGRTRIFPNDKDNVSLLAAGKAGQFSQVNAAHPRVRDCQDVRVRPSAFNNTGDAISCRGRLPDAGQLYRTK